MANSNAKERWLTTSALACATKNPESTVRYWTQRNLLEHMKTTTGQAIYSPAAVEQARALRAKRKR